MRWVPLPILLLLLLPVSACAPSEAPPEPPAGLSADDEASIRALVDEWDRAWEANDPSRVVALLSDDYVEALATAVVGREAALERYRSFTQTYDMVRSTVMRLEGEGDLAYAWIEFNGRYARADGTRMEQRGNVLWVLRREEDGNWRFIASGFQAASRPAEGA